MTNSEFSALRYLTGARVIPQASGMCQQLGIPALQGGYMNRSIRITKLSMVSLFQVIALYLCTFSTYASTSKELLNVFYFEHTYVSAADCASRGFPTQSIHADWLDKNASIHVHLSNEIVNNFIKRGLNKQQAETVLQGIRANYRRQSSSETRPSNTICGAFREYLSNISTLPNSIFLPTRAN